MTALPEDIIYEDNHLLVVNKPSGVLVQGDSTGDPSLIDHYKKYIKKKYEKPGEVFLGLAHRLDRPVSGAVVLTKTSKALKRMNELFRNRSVNKVYWALVMKAPPKLKGKLNHWLKKDRRKNYTSSFDHAVKDSAKAELHYKLMGKFGHFYLLEIKPVTGRPHQIRVQLAHIGCPIVGDVKYGFQKANDDKSISLHARQLSFVHPVRKTAMTFEAELPKNTYWKSVPDEWACQIYGQ